MNSLPRTSATSMGDGRADIRRILFIRFGGIGDILMTTPTLRAVKARYPLSQIDYLVSRGFRDVLQGHPAINAVLEFQKRGEDVLPHRLIPFLMALHNAKYDLVVNLQPSVKTKIMTSAAAPRLCLDFRKDQTFQGSTSRRRHAVNDFYETIRPLGVPKLEDRTLDFSVSSDARAEVDRLLSERGFTFGMRLIVLHAAANHRVNRWPATYYSALCNALAHRSDTFVVLSGHAKDGALIRSIRSAVNCQQRCLDLSGLLSLKALGALLERADVFVTGDTGPMHIASAVGTPMISLFGAADPDRTGPLTASSRILAERSLPCAPCHSRACQYGKEARCMTMLLPPTVIAAVDERMNQSWQIARLQMETVKQ